MPTTLTNGIQLPDKGSVDWYNSMQSNYNLIDTHLGNTDIHVTAEDKANWDSKQGSLSQAQLDAIAQVATNTSDIASLQSGKANASHTHSSSDITDIGDYATKQYVDNSISGLVDSAPNALDTLKELSTALNDDANFASTVTNALSTKANSADLATVATSGSYNDLSNKPTINDSTITIQKNGSTVDTFTTNGSNKTIDIPVPTKTSDLTNDSNFVDTSNSAVASGITSAKVTSYDSHVANTDIHVTTADKTKWNNGVSQAYVLRYSSTAITDNSTIAYSTLDNTDNIKVSDKIIDTDGKIFSIVSVDSDNSTVTVGSALIDIALDANVVHTSGNETVSGSKTFTWPIAITSYPCIRMYLSDDEWNVQPASAKQSEIRFTDKNAVLISYITFQHRTDANEPFRTCWRQQKMDGTSGYFSVNFNNLGELYPENYNSIKLGKPNNRWLGVYAMNYYYGANDVEFSTKFVTSDTTQTISGSKVFSSTPSVYNSNTSGTTANLYFRNQLVTKGDTSTSGSQIIRFSDSADKMLSRIQTSKVSNGSTTLNLRADTVDTNNNDVTTEIQLISGRDGSKSLSPQNNDIDLGRTLAKWKNLYINLINGLTPSSLGMPDLNNGIDISSYITVNGGNKESLYTPTVNGWISVALTRTGGANMAVMLKQGNFASSGHNIAQENGTTTCNAMLPVKGGVQVSINSALADGIYFAYFYPCQGNV